MDAINIVLYREAIGFAKDFNMSIEKAYQFVCAQNEDSIRNGKGPLDAILLKEAKREKNKLRRLQSGDKPRRVNRQRDSGSRGDPLDQSNVIAIKADNTGSNSSV